MVKVAAVTIRAGEKERILGTAWKTLDWFLLSQVEKKAECGKDEIS